MNEHPSTEKNLWAAVDEATAEAEAAIEAAIEAFERAEAASPKGPGTASDVFHKKSQRWLRVYEAYRQAGEAGKRAKAVAERKNDP